ncbi:MAG: hypothetical protein ACRDHW_15065 [Ktedonobacteraceae bacterium]
MTKYSDPFPGFAHPDNEGYTRIPNEFMEKELSNIDSLAELKVILYLMRHTWGYQEYMDSDTGEGFKWITTEEFIHGRWKKRGRHKKAKIDDGTGLSDYGVRTGLKKAIEHGYILEDVNDQDKARIRKSYALKMKDP